MARYRLLIKGSSTRVSPGRTRKADLLEDLGDGVFLAEEFGEKNEAVRRAEALVKGRLGLELLVVQGESDIVAGALDVDGLGTRSDEEDRRSALMCWLGYAAVSGAILYALLPFPWALLVQGVLCAIYLGSMLLFGPRSSIELGLIPAVILLIFVAITVPKLRQLVQASGAAELESAEK